MGDVYIPPDMRTGEPRGFAFVRFLDERDANDDFDQYDGELQNGREIRIELSINVLNIVMYGLRPFCSKKE